ncbi:MAG TPA: type IV toxin-antitoxin system AbiEi family antitoxin domain-containing protein [Cellulomonas sp.]
MDVVLHEMARSGVVLTAEAAARGCAPGDLRRAVQSGVLHRVRRGVYVGGPGWRGSDQAARHLIRVRAAAAVLTDVVFSHRSAAAAWGLPLLGPWPEQVEVVAGPAGGGRSTPGIRRRAVPVPVVPTSRGGLRVTDLVRTAVDLACTESLASAVVAADHALRSRGLVLERARQELDGRGAARGVRRARRVLELADPRAESVGESLSRVRMVEHGIPAPELQHEFRDRLGVVGRVDFWWPGARLVGEFDGRLKYRADDPEDGRPPEERVWAEKVREDRLRALGVRVVRWTWSDAWLGEPLADRLRAAGVAR